MVHVSKKYTHLKSWQWYHKQIQNKPTLNINLQKVHGHISLHSYTNTHSI